MQGSVTKPLPTFSSSRAGDTLRSCRDRLDHEHPCPDIPTPGRAQPRSASTHCWRPGNCTGSRACQSLGITESSPWRLAGMCPDAPRASPCPSQHPCAGGSGDSREQTPVPPSPAKGELLVGEAEEGWEFSPHPCIPHTRGNQSSTFLPPAATGSSGPAQSAALISWSCRGIHQECLRDPEKPRGTNSARGAAPRTCFY